MSFGLQTFDDKAPRWDLDEYPYEIGSGSDRFYEFFDRRFSEAAKDTDLQRKLTMLAAVSIIIFAVLWRIT